MKLSKKIIYGYQFMLYLTINYSNKSYVKLSEFSKKQKISDKFLENIAVSIKSKGLIDVKRGSTGGYRLAKSPENITLLEVYDAIEGKFGILENEQVMLNDQNRNVIYEFWDDLNNIIIKFLINNNLAELANKFLLKSNNQMFYI